MEPTKIPSDLKQSNLPLSMRYYDSVIANVQERVSNEVRIRDESEVTTLEEGDDPEDQTYYIICAATGVSCPCPTAAFVSPAPPPQYIVCFTFHFARIFLILPSCLRNCPKRTRLPHFSLVCALPPAGLYQQGQEARHQKADRQGLQVRLERLLGHVARGP